MLAPVDDENRRVVPEAERRERFIKDSMERGKYMSISFKIRARQMGAAVSSLV